MTGSFSVVASLACGLLAGAVNAQGPWTPPVAAPLSPEEMQAVTFVSSMKIEVGNWSVKPIYRPLQSQVRVIGFLVTADQGSRIGSNYGAVFFERPAQDDTTPWSGRAWSASTAHTAAGWLKQHFNIPDFQDQDWEMPLVGMDQMVGPEPYVNGFAVEDSLGQLVAAFDHEPRFHVLELLQVNGYPVADIPFEMASSPDSARWLSQNAMFFESVIGQNLSAEEFTAAVRRKSDLGPWPARPFAWEQPCLAERIVGEWKPIGVPCACRTYGPFPIVCGTFTADARGKLSFRLPWPPPLGTLAEFEFGVNAVVNICICGWERRCFAAASRTVKIVHPDCTVEEYSEISESERAFHEYGYVVAASEAACALYPPPAHLPPDSQPCGLRVPTQHDP